MLLAIETSCDETAVAILDMAKPLSEYEDVKELLLVDLVSSQMKLHEPFGGVVPELASRAHLEMLPKLVAEAFSKCGRTATDISAVAVTRGPGLKGCLLVGLTFAKSFSFARNVPLLPLHHIEGHLFAGEFMALSAPSSLPMLALVVSGGHTMLVHQPQFRDYKIIARTRDDAAGEAFDKCAALLGLPYPGGPALSNFAQNGDVGRFALPVGMPGDPTAFSFSGLKTAVLRLVEKEKRDSGSSVLTEQTVADLAASIQGAIVKALVKKSIQACIELKPKTFLLTGGVASNESLRAELIAALGRMGIPFVVPERRWCTDNAAMIGYLARRIMEHSQTKFSGGDWRSKNCLGPGVPLDVGALARWPLDSLGAV